jgi:hypothetical protein
MEAKVHGHIKRPVEDYVIARLTIQERMARLTPGERMAVVVWACGFGMTEWAEVRGTIVQNESQAKLRGLDKLGPELQPPKLRPGPGGFCTKCGKPAVYAKGLCNSHYVAMRRRERKAAA